MKSETYLRSENLIDNYLKFVESVNKTEPLKNISIDNFVYLKSVLSDIHNVMTLLTTLSFSNKLADVLHLNPDEKTNLIQDIENKKANSNGFDIRIDYPKKILVEVKCNSLIHDKKYGAKQINAILDDARKLRLESPRHAKASNEIHSTDDYIKIVALVNFSSKSDDELLLQITRETKCRETTNNERKERMKIKKYLRILYNLSDINLLQESDKANVYLYVLSKNDLNQELKKIINQRN